MDSNVPLSTSLNDSLIEEEDHSVPKRKRKNEWKKERETQRRKRREREAIWTWVPELQKVIPLILCLHSEYMNSILYHSTSISRVSIFFFKLKFFDTKNESNYPEVTSLRNNCQCHCFCQKKLISIIAQSKHMRRSKGGLGNPRGSTP